ncbi:ribonuclease III [candidate division WWE3 bacterium CG09_land_8_20_14_0_10_39_24]|uniref:Ribonuclease 3 n=2 Tax=Katanobacteria TaxID=422282 RepID=A0A2G9XCC7_UNCKA|nr:MAG: ribonuclease III [bacterium CG2_30_40_12]OJI08378.1 MAG: ribonuclease III [bacterium CG09_39_24]PIP04648.1 MAG: ribonuclease III [candidate division WWE3 bacterium CG23_combo_of_CG06-09_8_20_14_all_40_14]PIS12665.1 MAG: ribonuclease III [candidate division WWE3 bacterium CG09_land_8_20_14_0_10_39_24]PJE50887.1 MAG: ribonuclease III [candidate division WWE3 bacterium CG10_big_fil_rev_8_21_14_0_10_39_14]
MNIGLAKLEKKLNIIFSNKDILNKALTHRSYLNEHKDSEESNERLEFLGDSILQFLTSEYLYKNYSSPEGLLTSYRAAVVRTESLAEESAKLGVGEFLMLSKGEEATGGRTRPYILANTFEALLGAIYLDQGLEISRKFLEKTIFPKIAGVVKEKKYKDSKSSFQELAQERKNVTPIYKILKEWGPDHDKNFKAGVFITDSMEGTGEGNSKQKAEEAAAQNALEKWEARKLV